MNTPSAESVASFKNARLTGSLVAHPSSSPSNFTPSSTHKFKENLTASHIDLAAHPRSHRKPPLGTALTAASGVVAPQADVPVTSPALSLTGSKPPPGMKSARASFFKSVISYCSPASSSHASSTRKTSATHRGTSSIGPEARFSLATPSNRSLGKSAS